MYTKHNASRMASPRASPARLQYNKGVTEYAQDILSIVKIIEPEAGPPFTRYNSSLHNVLL